jgi:hypothetical protein
MCANALSAARELIGCVQQTDIFTSGATHMALLRTSPSDTSFRTTRCPRNTRSFGITVLTFGTYGLTGSSDNSIFRGYNSIYQQAPIIADQDKADFVGYCLTWYKFVKSHHDDEETTLFTKIEELLKDKTIFEETHKEHG